MVGGVHSCPSGCAFNCDGAAPMLLSLDCGLLVVRYIYLQHMIAACSIRHAPVICSQLHAVLPLSVCIDQRLHKSVNLWAKASLAGFKSQAILVGSNLSSLARLVSRARDALTKLDSLLLVLVKGHSLMLADEGGKILLSHAFGKQTVILLGLGMSIQRFVIMLIAATPSIFVCRWQLFRILNDANGRS